MRSSTIPARVVVLAGVIVALLAACASESSSTGSSGDHPREYTGDVCPGAVGPSAGDRVCSSAGACDANGGGDCISKSQHATRCATYDRPCEPACGADQVCTSGCTPHCVARCTETSCPADQLCAPSGLCVLRTCSQGFECPKGTTCDSAFFGDPRQCRASACTTDDDCGPNTRCLGDKFGGARACTPIGCSVDRDCDCGVCLIGVCAPSAGACFVAPK